MAKSSKRRHHAQRILNRWYNLHRALDYVPETSLSFGKVFKQDPLDCGNPQCQLCHRDKVFKSPKNNTIRGEEE